MSIVFVISLSLIALIILGYPLALWIMSFRAQPTKRHASPASDKISVILPCYNEEDHILRKINSLQNQLPPESEIIVVDDGSTDESAQLLSRFLDTENITVISSSRQMGKPHALNLGVSLARNELLLFCDARQSLMPNCISELLATLTSSGAGAASACLKTAAGDRLRKSLNTLKSLEAQSGSLCGVYGAPFLMHRDLYRPLPWDIVLDDLFQPLSIEAQGYQVAFSRKAQISDSKTRRRNKLALLCRMMSGSFQLLRHRAIRDQLPAQALLRLWWHKTARLLLPTLILLAAMTGWLSLSSSGQALVALTALWISAGWISSVLSRSREAVMP